MDTELSPSCRFKTDAQKAEITCLKVLTTSKAGARTQTPLPVDTPGSDPTVVLICRIPIKHSEFKAEGYVQALLREKSGILEYYFILQIGIIEFS